MPAPTTRLGVPAKYERRGLLAIEPGAFAELFLVRDSAPPNTSTIDGLATIIHVRGPLEQHAGWCWDSYESITSRVLEACGSAAPNIVLRLSSPGGEVAGCFETAREIQAICARANKNLIAYVDERACSAAYALACAASHIVLGDTALVGSIGVLATRPDYSAMNAARGYKVAFIASGDRKTDGNPDSPISDSELAATQRIVDSLAEVFFELVQERRGLDPRVLQAGVFHGADAVEKGLADEVMPWSSLLGRLSTKGFKAMADDNTEDPVASARAMLEKAAAGTGAAAASAKRALAAMDEKPPEKAEDSDDDKPAAADDSPAPSDDDKDKKESARAMAAALRAEAKANQLEAMLAAKDEQIARDALLATRPDLAPETLKTLAKAPLSLVRELVETLPRIATGAGATAALAAAGVAATRGDDSHAPSRLPPQEKAALDARMGLGAPTASVVNTDYKLTLGPSKPAARPTNTEGAPHG